MDRTTATNFPTRYFYDTTTGGFYDPLACLAQPGYGFDGFQATPCPKGEYNDAIGEDANKCSVCPIDGTTTYSEGSQSAADCKYVLPGWQFPNAADPAASLSKCDYGFFSPIDREIRANNASVCPAGQGIAEGGSSCQLCPSSFYGDEARTAGNFTCERCPAGSNNYRFRFQSGPSSTSDNLFTSAVVTKPGASSVGQCSVEFGQAEDGNWKLTSSGSNVAGNSADLDACVASCRAKPECQFLNYDYPGDVATRCQLRVSTARTIGTTLLAYKVVPNSNLLAASMGSGLFSWWVDDAAQEVGIYVNTIATSSMADCVSTCTLKSECAAVRMDGYSSAAKTITSCTLLKGAVTMTETVRTLVRTRIDNDISITAGPVTAPLP
uniref:Tyrosine-protein kinase ephrin type A/B receptor-like domain-containing protein n=1 Tax=Tetradesmus obliquus TaxID=3088 RepID=A0A383V9I5_TETOB|eukprot:jgi/Sobl393_1/3507/SZX60996.1